MLKVVTLLTMIISVPVAFGASCHVVQHGQPSDAEKALLAADLPKAESLFREALKSSPHDSALQTGLVHALLRQKKLRDARDTVDSALSSAAQDANLITLRGEVEYREGVPWEAAKSAEEARKIDPCNARAILLSARVARLSSFFATSRKLIQQAHLLDPQDMEIQLEWINTLPPKQHIAELEAFLHQANGRSEEELRNLRESVETWKKYLDEPHKSCRLVSTTTTAVIPFIRPASDSSTQRKFNLEAQLNSQSTSLEINTGGSGMLVTQHAAQRAGLKPLSQTTVSGVGDEGTRQGYIALVDSIRIGGLEFRDCAVRVLDDKYMPVNKDGIVGMDVFSRFLVTLDFPMRKLILGPLPERPDEIERAKPALITREYELGEDTAEPHDRWVAPEMKDYTRVYRFGHDLIVPASLNERKLSLFILATGAWATVISPDAAHEVTKVRDDYNTVMQGLNGDVKSTYSADSVTFRFANLSQKMTGALVFDMSMMSRALGMEISGLLGASTLNQVTMHIDYRDGLVKFDYDPKRGLY